MFATGWPNPPHTLTYSIETPQTDESAPYTNLRFHWSAPLHTAGLERDSLQYKVEITWSQFSTHDDDTDAGVTHYQGNLLKDTYTCRVAIVDQNKLISEWSLALSVMTDPFVDYRKLYS